MIVASVGFAGLGRMGSRMAANVAAAGFELTVWNRTRERADAFLTEKGAAVADSPADLAGKADVVITMLADDAALRDVYEGDDGLLAGLRSGSMAVEMSTVGPPAVHWLRERLAPLGVGLVDAPVSGSTELAAARRIMIMAGGDEADVERVRPVLDAIGSPVLFLGPSGSGATMKLAVNDTVYGLVQAAAEALVLAERAGIDRAKAYEVFLNSAIAAPALRYRETAFVRPGEEEPLFTLELAAKDLRLITGLADQVSARMPQANATLAALQSAIDAGYGDEDLAGMAGYLREASD
jgi:3-hydroxyisobutyrate dehydrogenase-like beta-hydroxyacid dehydrogenase